MDAQQCSKRIAAMQFHARSRFKQIDRNEEFRVANVAIKELSRRSTVIVWKVRIGRSTEPSGRVVSTRQHCLRQSRRVDRPVCA